MWVDRLSVETSSGEMIPKENKWQIFIQAVCSYWFFLMNKMANLCSHCPLHVMGIINRPWRFACQFPRNISQKNAEVVMNLQCFAWSNSQESLFLRFKCHLSSGSKQEFHYNSVHFSMDLNIAMMFFDLFRKAWTLEYLIGLLGS